MCVAHKWCGYQCSQSGDEFGTVYEWCEWGVISDKTCWCFAALATVFYLHAVLSLAVNTNPFE